MNEKEKLTETRQDEHTEVAESLTVSGGDAARVSQTESPSIGNGNDGELSAVQEAPKALEQDDPAVLKQNLETISQKLAETEDKYLRLYAEFENYKKRMLRERMEMLRLAGSDIMLSLLPVLDDFTRALKQLEAANDPMVEGVRLIYQKLRAVLEARGLKPMQSVGEPYSPDLHEAISEIEAGEEQRGKVVDEVECGYYLNDKIIRHAKVVVGK
ncbi:MAG: nucleotide exchange factor GrpE [Chitinophagales bacterium]|nr:nucleotide exchange factor GrpE [Chitinophagales bacterium]MDW8427260.1 nucleotide exchange factor GrpE [Chitinophagales bacterium]